MVIYIFILIKCHLSQLRTVTKHWYSMVTFSLGPKSIAVVQLIGNATTILKRTIHIVRLRVPQLVMNLLLVEKLQCTMTTPTAKYSLTTSN